MKRCLQYLFLLFPLLCIQGKLNAQGLQGIVLNAKDFKPLANASVIAPHTKETDLTAEDGSFSFWRTHPDTLVLYLRKEGFADTAYTFCFESGKEYRFYMRAQQQNIKDSTTAPHMGSNWLNTWYALPQQLLINTPHYRNCRDTFYADYALSILPGIGTNHKLAAHTINKAHLNILAGVSAGAEDFEVGLGININYGKVRYVQIAGLANYAAGEVKGTQITAGINTNVSAVQGLQIAGLLNLNADTLKGIQISLLANYNLNYTEGMMFATLYNQGTHFKGLQVSGGINKTQYIDGLQIGLINITDSCKGVPVGVFSYVKKGYRSWELATDEKTMTTLAFKSGVDIFHNEFLAGAQLSGSNKLWALGYGLGSITPSEKKTGFDVNLNILLLMPIGAPAKSLNWTGKLTFSALYPLGKRVQVFAGPALSFSILNTSDPNYYSYYNPYPLGYMYDETWGDIQLKSWIGVRGGIRFY